MAEYEKKARATGKAPAVDKLDLTVGDVFEGWKALEYRKLGAASITSYNAAWNKRISRYAGRKMRSMTLDEWQSILDEDEDGHAILPEQYREYFKELMARIDALKAAIKLPA